MATQTQVFGSRSRVIVNMNDRQAQRVFVRFADKDAKKRATKVLVRAKIEAPTGKGPNAGNLKSKIDMSQSRDARGRWSTGYDVTSNAPYSLYVIKGTRAHRIYARPALAFTWNGRPFVILAAGATTNVWEASGTTFVRGKGYVDHPGTRANNFLGRALRAAR